VSAPEDPEVVFESAEPMEVAMGMQLLQEAGIPCAVSGQGASSYLTAVFGEALAGVQVIEVPPEFAERARGVLERAWGEGEAAEADESDT